MSRPLSSHVKVASNGFTNRPCREGQSEKKDGFKSKQVTKKKCVRTSSTTLTVTKGAQSKHHEGVIRMHISHMCCQQRQMKP